MSRLKKMIEFIWILLLELIKTTYLVLQQMYCKKVLCKSYQVMVHEVM